MEHDIRHYDLESVPMTLDPVSQNPRLLTLEVGAWIGGGDVGRTLLLTAGQDRGRVKLFLLWGLSKGQCGHPGPKKSVRQDSGKYLGVNPDFAATSSVAVGKSFALARPSFHSLKNRAGRDNS